MVLPWVSGVWGERLRGVDKHTRSSGGLPGAADAWGIGECEYLIKNLSDAGVARNRKVNAGAGIALSGISMRMVMRKALSVATITPL